MIEDRKDAVVEAGIMLRTPMNELPELAMGYLKFLSNKIGMCLEVCLTAYAVYNQMVLDMDCNDELYFMTDPDSIKWWSDRGYERIPKEKTPLKLFQIQVDSMTLTLLAKNEVDAFNIFKSINDDEIYIESGVYHYRFNDEYSEPFEITEVPMVKGIIHWESH